MASKVEGGWQLKSSISTAHLFVESFPKQKVAIKGAAPATPATPPGPADRPPACLPGGGDDRQRHRDAPLVRAQGGRRAPSREGEGASCFLCRARGAYRVRMAGLGDSTSERAGTELVTVQPAMTLLS